MRPPPSPTHFALTIAATAFFAPSSSEPRAAEPPTLRTYIYRPGPAAVLVARMDASWHEESQFHAGELQLIRFVRQGAKAGAVARGRAKLLVTPMATLPGEKLLHDGSGGRKTVERGLEKMKATAVEKNPIITDATVGDARVVSFTVTDAQLKPGEFPLATQGVLTLGGIPCSLTILYDEARTRDEVVSLLGGWSAFGAVNVVEPVPDQAFGHLEAACRGGDALACGLANEMLHDALKPEDRLKLLTAGCNAGSAFACGSLGSLYAEGQGVPKDEARAMKILLQGCDAHGWLACVNAASLSNRGRPESATPTVQSLGFIERACGYGGDRDEVCRYSADAKATPTAYVADQRKGCAAGDGVACRRLGWAIETGYADAVVDVDAARAAYAQACLAHSLWGCFRQALFTADAKEQARLLDAACRAGSGPACYAFAQPKYGQPTVAHRKLARQACESSIEEACADVLRSLGP